VIDFEFFRGLLASKLLNLEKKNTRGAKAYDFVVIFKLKILQWYFGLDDDTNLSRTTQHLNPFFLAQT